MKAKKAMKTFICILTVVLAVSLTAKVYQADRKFEFLFPEQTSKPKYAMI